MSDCSHPTLYYTERSHRLAEADCTIVSTVHEIVVRCDDCEHEEMLMRRRTPLIRPAELGQLSLGRGAQTPSAPEKGPQATTTFREPSVLTWALLAAAGAAILARLLRRLRERPESAE